MEIRQITEDYSVAPQIGLEHVPLIKAAGFKSVISNRPDSEDGAVPHGEIEAAVREAGMEFRYIPVISGQMTQQNVDDQAAALDALAKPVLAYCRSGARCTNLYALVSEQRD
ncbi:TIGR01244 family sulfur transferase [Mesorhizobium sp. CAU 1741]|uniref:TIGR01244 family sulfur transferase n=1 Tax=Mesorhizobium sp. CAU 1741 TaxID=3140366 RepID=UPI00325B379D